MSINSTANPFDQLRQEFKQELTDLRHFISLTISGNHSINKLDEDTIIEIDEASEITKYSKPAIYAYCKKGKMPYIRKGRKILFSKKDLQDWLQDGRKLTLSEIQRNSLRLEPVTTNL